MVGDAPSALVRPLAFVPPSGQVWRSYYYAGAQRIAMRVEGDSNPANNGLFYLLSDHLGSTSVTTDASGTKVAELRYYPYGQTRYSWNTTPTSHRFTGQISDESSTGLYFYGARYFDPLLGRFLSADTIVPGAGNPQSLNRYSYVYNSPLNYTDPTGHDACTGTPGTYEPDCGVDGWWGPPLQIWSEAEVARTRAEFTQVFELIGSILSEPADWALTIRDCASGNCSLPVVLATITPFIPGRVGRLTHGLTHKLQQAIMDSLDEGVIAAVRGRPYGANFLDWLRRAKAPGDQVVQSYANGSRLLSTGERVASDLDLAGVTRNGVPFTNLESEALGRQINTKYGRDVVTHGDLYNGRRMGNPAALAVDVTKPVYVFDRSGFIEMLPYAEYVQKYIGEAHVKTECKGVIRLGHGFPNH